MDATSYGWLKKKRNPNELPGRPAHREPALGRHVAHRRSLSRLRTGVGSWILMPEDRLPADFLTFARGAWVAKAFRFPAFLVERPAPELAAAIPAELVSVA
jgi:hypothetical protein